jgi:hypothetical protein
MTQKQFQQDIENWDNHRYLLWPALEATKVLRLPVLELGCGHGSTKYLRQYCEDNGLELYSYDFNADYAHKFGATYVTNWAMQVSWRKEWGVVLVDESPGEHRKESLQLLCNAQCIVVHDSEPEGWNASDYQVRPLFNRFKYVKDFVSPKPGAWATVLSNYVDVTKFEL